MNDNVIRDLAGYTTSRDYRELWELAQRQSVVCIVDSSCRPRPVYRLVAQTITARDGLVSVRSRGTGYADSIGTSEQLDGVEVFVRECQDVHLEWIVPNLMSDKPEPVNELADPRGREALWLASTDWEALATTPQADAEAMVKQLHAGGTKGLNRLRRIAQGLGGNTVKPNYYSRKTRATCGRSILAMLEDRRALIPLSGGEDAPRPAGGGSE